MVYDRQQLEQREQQELAPYAAKSALSLGREVPERPDSIRTEYQRDRDRILHCGAFRRLEYKTQVYVTHEGEGFRTRLTHTLEVAQIARTLASNLGLNRDLTEAIALAHDLGHAPFGHTGETVLNELLAGCGGFEHNAQSLRVVEVLEERFHDRPGLNLTWEVREGIAHHSTVYDHPPKSRYHNGKPPLLEAQLIDLCDEIAFNHHDLDDALKMRLLEVEQLREVPWVWSIWEDEQRKLPAGTGPDILKFRALGAVMDLMVHDALEHSGRLIDEHGVDAPEGVRAAGRRLICFSESMQQRHNQLRDFLMREVYCHSVTLRMQSKAGRFLRRLFHLYRDDPALLPVVYQARARQGPLARVVADYLSSMTDRNCLEDYMLNFEPTLSRHRRDV